MAEFASVYSYLDFATSVCGEWRYTRSPQQSGFLSVLVETSKSRVESIPAGSLLFRAQLGCEWPETEEDAADPGPRGYSPERMLPLKYRAQEGRVNPRGIPCLYTATVEQTAATEVRPWIGAYISVAQLRVKRDVRIVNCTSDDRRMMVYFHEPDPAERERAVWRDVDRAFAQPVDRDDHRADYAPTQVIAEVFRQQGLDGLGYRSSLGEGHNIAFFDVDIADLINCTVHYVHSIEFHMDEAANCYYVTKHNPQLNEGDA